MLEISQSNHYNVFVVSGNSAPTLSFFGEIQLTDVGGRQTGEITAVSL